MASLGIWFPVVRSLIPDAGSRLRGHYPRSPSGIRDHGPASGITNLGSQVPGSGITDSPRREQMITGDYRFSSQRAGDHSGWATAPDLRSSSMTHFPTVPRPRSMNRIPLSPRASTSVHGPCSFVDWTLLPPSLSFFLRPSPGSGVRDQVSGITAIQDHGSGIHTPGSGVRDQERCSGIILLGPGSSLYPGSRIWDRWSGIMRL